MVLKKDSSTPPLSRGFVFAIGAGVTAFLGLLVWVYVPEKSTAITEEIKFSKVETSNSAEPNNSKPDNAEATNTNATSNSSAAREDSATLVFATLKPEESYTKYCAQCHGKGGEGDTPMARMAGVKPTNLISGPYKYARTIEGISALIQNGNGNSMPGFGRELGEANSNSLAQYVLGFEKKTPTP